MSEIVDVFAGLLLAVAALGLLAHKLKMAYPILLVLGGLGLGLIPGLPHMRLNPEFIFLVFLPPLLFPSALFTSWRDFRANLRPILLLAVGLVLFTTVLVGWCAHYFIGLPLSAGFVLGAIISPPDAIAATAIVERLSVPRRIVTILEGESLVNDATALVAYQFAVAAVVTGSFSLTQATGQFLVVCVGGIVVGLAAGWAAAWFHRHVEDAPVEITVSLFTPFVTYLAAHRLHVSGVLAVVTAGIFLGRRTPEITSSNTRLLGGPFWNMVEFLLNGFVFILIGFALPDAVRALTGHSVLELVGYALGLSLSVILIRILWVFPATYLPRLLFRRIRECDPCPAWQHVTIVAWTGMRGVVSLAAALALPLTREDGSPFPGRDLILFLTFVVILATLVLQGISLPFLIRWLGIKDDRSAEKEERAARLKANEAALARLKEIAEREPTKAEAANRLRVEYEDRVRQLEAYDGEASDSRLGLFSSEYESLSNQALAVERRIIVTLRDQGVISDEVLRRVQRDIDLAEARLRLPQ
jgi:Na+/H+ antiporter